VSQEPRTIPVSARATAHLRASDSTFAALIDRVGSLEYRSDPNLWRALVGSIIGQQLSTRAAATIRGRVASLGGDVFPGPEAILTIPDETLRSCGLSRAKLGYLRDLAVRWSAGEVKPEELYELPDEEVVQRLVLFRGVGRWTAEMVLIFSLERQDVLAVDDLGIRSAVQKAYGLPHRPDPETLRRIAQPWRPYRSIASLFLWRGLTLQPPLARLHGSPA